MGAEGNILVDFSQSGGRGGGGAGTPKLPPLPVYHTSKMSKNTPVVTFFVSIPIEKIHRPSDRASILQFCHFCSCTNPSFPIPRMSFCKGTSYEMETCHTWRLDLTTVCRSVSTISKACVSLVPRPSSLGRKRKAL